MLNVQCCENRTPDFYVHEQPDALFYVIDGQFETSDMIIIPKGRATALSSQHLSNVC
jgi:hypothetical protein